MSEPEPAVSAAVPGQEEAELAAAEKLVLEATPLRYKDPEVAAELLSRALAVQVCVKHFLLPHHARTHSWLHHPALKQVQYYGKTDIRCAATHLHYGIALLEQARNNTDAFCSGSVRPSVQAPSVSAGVFEKICC